MQVQSLTSDFLGDITFPHYTKVVDDTQSFSAGVIHVNEISEGELFSIHPLKKNARVFSITKVFNKRKAMGECGFTKEWPSFCNVEGKLVGFYNQVDSSVSESFLP